MPPFGPPFYRAPILHAICLAYENRYQSAADHQEQQGENRGKGEVQADGIHLEAELLQEDCEERLEHGPAEVGENHAREHGEEQLVHERSAGLSVHGGTVAAAGATGQPRRRLSSRRSTPAVIQPTLAHVARALILTGERGAGKTALCLSLAASSPRFVGLLSPPLLVAGNRVGFSARCLDTGEEWTLGRSDAELGGPRFGRFSFSSAGIERAVESLRGSLLRSRVAWESDLVALPSGDVSAARGCSVPSRSTPPAPQPIVIVDEIGPLEFERGEGLAPVLPLLAEAGDLLLVARPSLLDRVEALVPRHAREVLIVTLENRDTLAPFLIDRFA